MDSQKANQKILIPGVTVFVSSVCVMILEIAAGRLTAIQYGSSLYAWTSVIGITLAGLTIGNYAGGKIADRFSLRKSIGLLFAACAIGCITAIIFNNVSVNWPILWRLNPVAQVLAFVGIMFFVPSGLIGAISPVAVKMALQSHQQTGSTVGRMYASGAAGSILGTFIAGFWLIGTIGTINTIWVVTTAMILMALLFLPKFKGKYFFGAIMAFIIIMGIIPAKSEPELLYEKESQYCYIAVKQVTKEPDERQFIEDNMANHSRIIMGKIRELVHFYPKVYAWVTQEASKGREKLNTLTIGGGGYVFPRYILSIWPGSRADVVEIDPEVTKAAVAAFGLEPDSPIRTINLDGRNYVDDLLEKKSKGIETPLYDFVYMDSFNDVAVPWQMVTRQFNDKIFKILEPDGFYLVNMIDLYESGNFLASFINTMKKTFPYVYVVKRQARDDLPNNFIIICGKRPIDLQNAKNESFPNVNTYLMDDNELQELNQRTKWTILDDDYAPAETLLAPAVKRKTQATAAEKYIAEADRLYNSGKFEEAIDKYRIAIQICPAAAADVYTFIVDYDMIKNKYEDAEKILRQMLGQMEIQKNPDTLFDIHHKLSVIDGRCGNYEDGIKELNEAIGIMKNIIANNGGTAANYEKLGHAYAEKNDMKEAIENFKKAIELEPDNVQYRQTLAEALTRNSQKNEAIKQLNEGIQYFKDKGLKSEAELLKESLNKLK